ncbi:glycosyltransferase family 2 protein [Neobacillus vireti]|uniref:glycosyltransferase family 2 protein n=1 Tax=Neobacillus vireti TaxID=220686 RepID=UPI002FFDAFC9
MRRDHPAISVVVPIYNVEKYLHRTLRSILKQRFSDFELILVNDGSSDSCGLICNEFAELDERIRVIHKKNGGPSSARNVGIDTATGTYIVFIDPDDQVCKEYLTKLYNVAVEKKCDAVISGYKTVPNHVSILPGYKLETVMTGVDLILSSSNIFTSNDLCFAWRNIYSLSLIKEKEIRFNENIFIGEDTVFNLEFFLQAKRLYAIPECLYLYTVNNPESLTKVRFKPRLEKSLVVQYKIKKQLSEKNNLFQYRNYKKDFNSYNINYIYRLMVNNLCNCEDILVNEELKRIVNYPVIRESVKEIGFFYECNSFKEYIYYLALKFKIYPLLLK